MVSRKRLDYNFYGYLLPPVPRALRTSKGRARVKISTEDRKICAFDLLATVAGLLEGEKTESSLKPKHTHDEKSSKSQAFVHESCSQNAFAISGYVQDDSVSSPATILATSESHEIDYGDGSVVEENNKNEVPCFLFKINTERNCDGGSPSSVESHCGEIEDKNGSFLGVEKKTIKLENPMPFQTEPSLLSSDSCANVPSCIDHIGYSSLPVNRNGMNLNCKDDDENSSLCTHPIILPNNLICRESNTSADQKKRKSGDPTSVKKDLSNPDIKSKPVLHGQKICYTRQRTQRCYPYKKRKNFILTNDGMSGKGVFSSPGKNMYKEALDSSISELQEIRPAVIVTGKEPLPEVGISHVKLSIKSFIIPEICIDIAQNATIGSLKSKVLDIVTTVLGGGGLQVGVLVKGKRIQDDSKTLFQNGICNDDALNNLDFTLEPISHLVSPSFRSEKPPLFLSCDETQSINRCMKPGSCDDTVELHLPSSSINCLERDRDYVSSLPDTRLEETPNSKALVTVPSTSMDSLALVPFNKKSTRSDVGQRRIRRPFSVSEVEALVQAVEKLGTGRWRDVKLCAFDNAKHRTYVDLKDKWKTLVHTARISPQQRRGEPVPQELLDRVLLAHAHWSQHTKHQSEPCSLS